MNKLIFPLMIALAATLATTGCKKGTPKTTQIPGEGQFGIGTPEPNPPLPNGNPIEPGTGSGIGTGPGTGLIATSDNWDPANMTQDRAALAADTIHFAFDSAVVRDSEQSKLATVAEALKSDPNAKLLIEGNCDERGTEEYNRALGERRALAAREALAKLGIDPMRVRTISYGKDKPADSSHDEAAWSKNRRDDFVLCLPKTGA
ncbi:MAG TPA: OmpA family protein [Verrucomicrobiae bacterium]